MEAGLIKCKVFEESTQHFLPSTFRGRAGHSAHVRTQQAEGGPDMLQ